jgi:hypothetical protein
MHDAKWCTPPGIARPAAPREAAANCGDGSASTRRMRHLAMVDVAKRLWLTAARRSADVRRSPDNVRSAPGGARKPERETGIKSIALS